MHNNKFNFNILFVIGHFFPDQSGGPSNTLYWMTSELMKNDIKCKIITSSKGIAGIPLDKWVCTDYGLVLYNKTNNPKLSYKIISNTIKNCLSTDILFLTSIFAANNLIILLLIKLFLRLNIPIIWSVRGELSNDALQFSRMKKKVWIWFIKKLNTNNLYFHCTNTTEEKQVKYIIGENFKTFVIPNYKQIANIEPKELKNRGNYFLYVGRIHPIKCLENIITAFHNSGFKKKTHMFYIIGDGDIDYIKSLRILVANYGLEDNVKFLGHLKGETKNEYIMNAICLLLCSKSENFGNVILEALEFGTPVIASKGTPWKVLNERSGGYWIENDPMEISNKIDNFLGMNQEEYFQICINARNIAKDLYDISSHISEWNNKFSNIISNNE